MKILVSSCLLGENVRYDGLNSNFMKNKKISPEIKNIFMQIVSENEIFPFCPEVSAGLSTPRAPAEIITNSPSFRLQTKNGIDVTHDFTNGAKKCLDLCKKEGIKVALLKSKSPSCGNLQVYDGTFSGNLVNGMGVSAKILTRNQIRVFNENQIEKLHQYIKSVLNML